MCLSSAFNNCVASRYCIMYVHVWVVIIMYVHVWVIIIMYVYVWVIIIIYVHVWVIIIMLLNVNHIDHIYQHLLYLSKKGYECKWIFETIQHYN